jgi:hypothetical protein
MKLRQFGEMLAQQIAARTGFFATIEEPQTELLARLRREGGIRRDVVDGFHDLRRHVDTSNTRTTSASTAPVGSLVRPLQQQRAHQPHDRGLEALVGVGDHGLHARQAAALECSPPNNASWKG